MSAIACPLSRLLDSCQSRPFSSNLGLSLGSNSGSIKPSDCVSSSLNPTQKSCPELTILPPMNTLDTQGWVRDGHPTWLVRNPDSGGGGG